MDRLQTLEMFVAVAQAGGFSAAARTLRVSPPAVTRGIAELEARLGTALLHRSTRAVSLTDEGAAFLPEARRILGDLADAERQLRGAQRAPHGTLYVTASTMFGRLHVLPVVGDLIEAHPGFDARLLLIDRNVRLIEEGIDVAVRIGTLADSMLKAVRIGAVRPVIVASPGYLARFGSPASLAGLAGHRLIASEGPRAAGAWRLAPALAAPAPRLRVNTIDAAIAAAEAGLGLASVLDYQVEETLEAGRLIEVLKPDAPEMMPVSLLFEASRANSASTRVFIDAMRERARHCRWGRR